MLLPTQDRIEVVFALVVNHVVDARVSLLAPTLGGVNLGDGAAGEDEKLVGCLEGLVTTG